MEFVQENRELWCHYCQVTFNKKQIENFIKTKENFILDLLWVIFAILGKQDFFLKLRFCHFLLCRIPGKNKEKVPRKIS